MGFRFFQSLFESQLLFLKGVGLTILHAFL